MILEWDRVLGLGLATFEKAAHEIPEEITALAQQREEARKKGDFAQADKLRHAITEKGYILEDLPNGYKISKRG